MTSKTSHKSEAEVFYSAKAIVYIEPGSFTKWELLRESGMSKSISSAMGELLGNLQAEMFHITRESKLRKWLGGDLTNLLTDYMSYGDIYDGRK